MILNSILNVTKHTDTIGPDTWFLCEKSQYLPTALKKQAKGLIMPEILYNSLASKPSLPIILIKDSRRFWANLAVIAYPRIPGYIIGITGTNGKTTTAYLLYQILQALNVQAGYIGTLGVRPRPDQESLTELSKLTTPDAYHLHYILDYFVSQGITHVALEISSISLVQQRVVNLSLNQAIFTSFSQDHLDLHNTLEEYWNAKLQILALLKKNQLLLAHSSLNTKLLKQNIPHQIYNQNKYRHDSLIGFMHDNLQAACRVCEELGHAPEVIQEVLNSNSLNIPGRMEIVSSNPVVIIDYAHTPDALEKILCLFPKDKLIVVFGCGGDRDKSKRSVMGQIAHQNASIVIVTDDNPRSEDPESIRQALLEFCPNAYNIGSRFEAIKLGINLASQYEYVCIVAGKGHEENQIYHDTSYPFSDRQVIEEILQNPEELARRKFG